MPFGLSTLQGYIFWQGGGGFLSKLKNRKEFEGGLHVKGRRQKGGKEEKEESDKTHVKIPLWSSNDRKKSHNNREKF